MSLFSELIGVGNQAKRIGQYEVANIAFGLAIRSYFAIEVAKRKEIGVRLYLESQDLSGQGPEEVYYDLLGIEKGGEILCIPIPLLMPFVALCAMKTALLVERGEHGREVREDVPAAEIEEVWEKLFCLGDEYAIGDVLSLILA